MIPLSCSYPGYCGCPVCRAAKRRAARKQLLPVIPLSYASPINAIDEAFAKTRETVRELEDSRDVAQWSPAQAVHYRRAA